MLDMFDMPSEFAVSERPMSRQRAVTDLQTPLRGSASGAKTKKQRGSKKKSPSSAKKTAADAVADGSETAVASADSASAAIGAELSGEDRQLSDDDDDSGDASSGNEGVDNDTDENDDDDEAREDEAAAARKFAAVQAKVKQEFVAGQQHLKSTLKYGRVQ